MGAVSHHGGRSLHLVDIENLTMDPDPTDRELDAALAAYHSVVPRDASTWSS